ncbi:MAG: leucine--tRNA ligase [Candidatus Riflebacteria bacterium]|nr:leucine--tRNA ligase [Candidatus Riflebacteria bacterium]
MSERYDFRKLQEKWAPVWRDKNMYKTSDDSSKPKFYCLDFFPYPSGNGLSVGHLRNYVPTDVITRFKRMQGMNVLHPMGWDAFGLPAENYAIKMGVHPSETTAKNAANYRRQLSLVECSYDWDREINSTDPSYYKWTQWFFLLLFRRGLAYQSKGAQWWCPDCKTILANEQVENGRCWRCDNEVTKKDLKQWYFRITSYADRLLEDLGTVDWPDHIKKMQENWIGRKTGTEVVFKGVDPRNEADTFDLTIFTTRVDTIFGVTFLTLAPEHPLVQKLTHPNRKTTVDEYVTAARKKSEIDRLSAEKEKTGVPLGSYAVNPFNGERIPIFIGDYVLAGYGTGAVMAVPAHDERDFAFAQKYGLPIREVITPGGTKVGPLSAAFTEYGICVDSGEFSGLTSGNAIEKMSEWVNSKKIGSKKVNYKFRDWLISRQRYWGAPIPVIHCDSCGSVPVPEKDLPVLLPPIKEFKPGTDARSPLAGITDWVNVPCPKCGKPAHRETDTMDGFACSSWYFLRFVDPHLDSAPFSKENVARWAPVDLYVGGAEHAVMHLLYARFWTKVMQDEGLITFGEPFTRLRNQGMMLAADGQKMSKSKGNVITPDEMVERYGADTLRAFILFLGSFECEVAWSDEGIKGMYRFMRRVYELVQDSPGGNGEAQGEAAVELRRMTHKTVKAVTRDIEAFSFNTAVARLMEFVNYLGESSRSGDISKTTNWKNSIGTLLTLLAPITPFLAEDLWEFTGHSGSVHQQTWPTWDEAVLVQDAVNLPVQVNGKLRDQIRVPVNFTDDQVREECMKSEKIQKYLEGKTIVKFIHVPKRMASFVVK